ncbi:MAG: hypothetical protein WCY11_03680, partial [Novosphingobium sp.]
NAARACIDTTVQIEQYEALLATLKSQLPGKEVAPCPAAFTGWIEARLMDWRHTLSPVGLTSILRNKGFF